jgi:hypothetical protein
MLMDLLGPVRGTAYLAVKRSEAAHFAQMKHRDARVLPPR